jgi:hypothetical protein
MGNKKEMAAAILVEGAFSCSVSLTKHPETRGKIEIKIYPCFVIVSYIVLNGK